MVGVYRKNEFIPAGRDPMLQPDDELLIVIKDAYIKEIRAELRESGENVTI